MNRRPLDVYAYGMTVLTRAHLLAGNLPEADGYREIRESHRFMGGEAGMGALLLAHMGLKVRLDCNLLGRETREPLLRTCRERGIDASGLRYDPAFDGWQDLVLVHGMHRTVFGSFGTLLFDGSRKWTRPDPRAIARARVAAIDPFFGKDSERAARLCAAEGKPYVTLDCPPDGYLHRHAAANVVSGEYRRREHPAESTARLMGRYLRSSRTLTVFTSGAGDILYGRGGGRVCRLRPCRSKVRSTLGAGDSFRAGVVVGVLNGWEDERTVRFASALASLACERFPLADHPPSMREVLKRMGSVPRGGKR